LKKRIAVLELNLNSTSDSALKVDLLNSLSRELFVYEVEKSLRYAYEARTLAQRIDYPFGEGKALVNEAMGCRIRSDFKKSKQLAASALAIFEKIDDKSGQADALNNISFMELNMEDNENAVEHGLKALTLAQEGEDKEVLAFSFLVNGMLYELLGDYSRAMEHHLRSLSVSREISDKAAEGAAIINLGIVFRKIGEREKAKKYFEEAHEIFKDLNIQLMVSSSNFNLGKIYSEAADYPKALEHFNRCLQIQKEIGHAQGQGACYINIGTVHRKMGHFNEADENIRQSIELARSFGKKNSECKGLLELAECFLDQRMEHDAIDILEEVHNEAEIFGIKEIRQQVLAMLSRANEMRGDFRKAFSFYKEATSLHEELINEEIMLKMKGLTLLQDVETAKHEREIALKEKERAEQSEKFKEQFLANMSHEIRTPMNAIAGLADLLGKTTMNPLQSKYVKAIRQSTESLLGIVHDILDFSKIESGQTMLESINFSIEECMENVCSSLRHRAEEKSITLNLNFDEKIPALVSGDPLRLKQILINLTGNAIKFTEEGSVSVEAHLKKREGELWSVVFKVIDTGIGIPDDKLNDVFESFVQATPSTTRKFGGTGLGLTISKHLVEMQGGSISVKSKLGEGTEFSFIIPYSPAIEEKMLMLPDDGSAPLLKGLRVLVVEDNKFNQLVAVDSLRSMIDDVAIEVAENGKVALEKIHQQPFDLVLLDLQMPEMDGYETTSNVRSDPDSSIRELPIVALTANATKTEKEKCLSSGMNGYVSKPFRMEELLRQIRQVLTANASS